MQILFSGTADGDVTISDDAANYNRLSIDFVMDNTVYGSQSIDHPDKRWVFISAVRINNGIFIAGINYYVNGRTIQRGDEAHTFGHDVGSLYVSNSVDVNIVNVIGWK